VWPSSLLIGSGASGITTLDRDGSALRPGFDVNTLPRRRDGASPGKTKKQRQKQGK